jgi:hypothetical protein
VGRLVLRGQMGATGWTPWSEAWAQVGSGYECRGGSPVPAWPRRPRVRSRLGGRGPSAGGEIGGGAATAEAALASRVETA